MDEEQCPNCDELVTDIELMLHGGVCERCWIEDNQNPSDMGW